MDTTQLLQSLAEINRIQTEASDKIRVLQNSIQSSPPTISGEVLQDIVFKLNVGVETLSAVIDIVTKFNVQE